MFSRLLILTDVVCELNTWEDGPHAALGLTDFGEIQTRFLRTSFPLGLPIFLHLK